MRFALPLLLVLALAGCSTTPPVNSSGVRATELDAGPPPTNAEAVIRPYLRSLLKDPGSAQIENVKGPAFLTVKSSLLSGSEAYGWGVCFVVNAKNSFGAYVGFRTMTIIWRHGSIQKVFGDLGTNMFDQALATSACRQIEQNTASLKTLEEAPAPARVAESPTPVSRGSEWPRAEALAKAESCHTKPVAALAAKGPGFESYSVPCSNGDTMMVRCEFGNCRALR